MDDQPSERDNLLSRLLEEARAELKAGGEIDPRAWQAAPPDLADESLGCLRALRYF